MAHNGKISSIGQVASCAATVLCSAMLSACGGDGDNTVSRVAARVNDTEITIDQVDRQLAQSGMTDEADVKKASKDILNALIEQELLVQEAKRKRLDRNPEVMQSIEEAKRKILSQAYLERVVFTANPPTPVEIQAFYTDHPELFAKRKVYQIHVFSVPKDKVDDGLIAALDGAKTALDTVSILKGLAIDSKVEEVQWLAEQVPMEFLPTLVKMKAGDIASLEKGKQVVFLQLVGALDNPVDEAQARPMIEKYLTNSKNKALLDDKLKQLRRGENITYVGPFADTPPGTAQQAPETTPPQAAVQAHIQKGLEGLK